MNFLYAAYAATWIIHIVYLGTLVRRYQRLQQRDCGAEEIAIAARMWVGHFCPTL